MKSSYPYCPEDNRNKLLQYKYPDIKGYQLEDLEQLLGIPEFLDYSGIKVKKID